MIEKLDDAVESAAQLLIDCDRVRIISHQDVDGITSGGIICSALYRCGIPFHIRILSRLDEKVIKDLKGPIVFCDMGSGQPELVSQVDGKVCIIDHHKPTDADTEYLQANPHLVGIDGAFELSASGTAYAVAMHLGNNADLAGLAIAGALGDQQKMIGANKDILEEAVKHGVITISRGFRTGEEDISKLLEYSTNPYLDISGEPEEVKAILDQLGIHGRVEDLNEDEMRRLVSVLVLKVLKRLQRYNSNRPLPCDIMKGALAEVTESLISDLYKLNCEAIPDALRFSNVVNAAGKVGETALALSLCLRDRSVIDKAEQLYLNYQKKIISELKRIEPEIKEGACIRYVHSSEKDIIGALGGTIIRYVAPDKPIFVLIKEGEMIKISARGTRELVERKLNLSIAMREGAAQVGGDGGGHSIASGAAIPADAESKFIEIVDDIITRQLRGEDE